MTSSEPVIDWLLAFANVTDVNAEQYVYQLTGKAMILHVMRVASGMDSMVIGEPQIAGQLKAAYQMALDAHCVSGHFKQLFPTVFSVNKHIRSATELGRCPVSIACVAVKLLVEQVNDITTSHILLIGSGQMIELVATHVRQFFSGDLIIAGRSHEAVALLTGSVNAQAVTIGDVPCCLERVDAVISATASQLPIVGKGLIERVMAQRTEQPLCLIDLAMPRDIEPEVSAIPGVTLHNIDALSQVVEANKTHRSGALKQAEAMIDLHANDYERKMRIVDNADVIVQYRQRIDAMRERELTKALHSLGAGVVPEEALRQFSRGFANQILHQPTTRLRELAALETSDTLALVKAFFEL